MTKLSKGISALCIVISLILVFLLLVSFICTTGRDDVYISTDSKPSIMSKFEMFVNNAASEALDGIVPIKKVYYLAEDVVVAPEPDQELFGTADSAAELEALLADASELMDGQNTLFSTETQIMSGSKVNYYLDETILAITWKQPINGACYTFSEIKVADASQFRRYMADNTFGSSVQYRPSDMAATVNAVVAMSGDFYKFRDNGIVVYQREIHRFYGKDMDSLFIDSEGNFHFAPRSTMMDQSAAESYIKENNILFSLAFGPILVDNGVNVAPDSYIVGEINDHYSRAAIAQLGDKHYLLVTVNFEGSYLAAATVKSLASVLEELGCDKAYALDGGQTGTIVMNDTVINNVDFGYQRQISDIIYFASALPDREVFYE